MLNSFTNFLHALALGTYATLVYMAMQAGNVFYTPLIFLLFALLFVLKIFGVVVHLPRVERNDVVRRTFWAFIVVGVLVLNAVTLAALSLPTVAVIVGTMTTVLAIVFSLLHARTYIPIALSLFFVYLLAAFFTCGLLRTGFLLVVASNLLWILLTRVPYLYDRKYHNDLYHIALIISTFVLFHSVSLGLWQSGACMF